jgi:hypothetical protein
MVDLPRKSRKRKPKQPGWRTVIRRGEFIPVVVRTKQGDITIRFGVAADGNHIIDAPKHCCDIIAPDRRPKREG